LAIRKSSRPKRVAAPFPSDYGEFALHYSYNFPERLKVLN